MTDKEIKMWQDDLDMIEMLRTENEKLKERIAYLERSNNRREETIIDYRLYCLEQLNIFEKAIDTLQVGIKTYNGGGSRTALFEVISDTKNILNKEVSE